MIIIKRKQVTVIGLALLLGMAGYANWSYKKTAEEEITASNPIGSVQLVEETANFFDEARFDREVSRSDSIEVLNEIVYDEASGEETIAQAREEIQKIATRTGIENEIETQIKAKGFLDAMVYISDTGVNVIVKSEQKLTSESVAVIVSLVQEKTGAEPNNIKVVEAA